MQRQSRCKLEIEDFKPRPRSAKPAAAGVCAQNQNLQRKQDGGPARTEKIRQAASSGRKTLSCERTTILMPCCCVKSNLRYLPIKPALQSSAKKSFVWKSPSSGRSMGEKEAAKPTEVLRGF